MTTAVLAVTTTKTQQARAVCEIGLVLLDSNGRWERGWGTRIADPTRRQTRRRTTSPGQQLLESDIAPTMRQVAAPLGTALDGATVVGHRIQRDLDLLADNCRRVRHGGFRPAKVLDTRRMTEWINPCCTDLSLRGCLRAADLSWELRIGPDEADERLADLGPEALEGTALARAIRTAHLYARYAAVAKDMGLEPDGQLDARARWDLMHTALPSYDAVAEATAIAREEAEW